MSVRVLLPANMRQLADNQSSIEIAGTTVGEILQDLTSQFPDLKTRLLDADGQVQSFVNVFVNDQSIREQDGMQTEVAPKGEVVIVAALAGG